METNETDNNSELIYPLNELLESIGLLPIDVYIYELMIPILSLIGIILCTISSRILFNKIFTSLKNDYYRVITIS